MTYLLKNTKKRFLDYLKEEVKHIREPSLIVTKSPAEAEEGQAGLRSWVPLRSGNRDLPARRQEIWCQASGHGNRRHRFGEHLGAPR